MTSFLHDITFRSDQDVWAYNGALARQLEQGRPFIVENGGEGFVFTDWIIRPSKYPTLYGYARLYESENGHGYLIVLHDNRRIRIPHAVDVFSAARVSLAILDPE